MKTIGNRRGCLGLSLLLTLLFTLGACGLIKGIVNFDGSIEIPECSEEEENCSEPKQAEE